MINRVDVAIVGAGSAGLAALREVRKVTREFVLIDDGPLGTMCARAGCMPSKALIHAAESLDLEIPEALVYVRKLRDRFAGELVGSTLRLGGRLIRGRARLTGPNDLRVGKREIRAKRVILATGSSPVVPEAYMALGARVATTDTIFELDDLPKRIGVIGLGPVGLELGQALSRLGCDVRAFDRSRSLGQLTDPAVNSYAVRHFAKEFALHFGADAKPRERSGKLEVLFGGRAYGRDLILACLGRRPNLGGVGLEALGVSLDKDGMPAFDPGTMKLRGLPIYLAGDASAVRPVQHEAADDGRIAGYNSVHPVARRFRRRAPLAITFCDPNIAVAGKSRAELGRRTFVTGEARFETQARALILGENHGLLHVYAGAGDGKFLGAEMIGPAGEHLAHLMAWALQQGLTVFEMLRMPFYHPTIEEGLRTALRDAAGKVKSGRGKLELSFCD